MSLLKLTPLLVALLTPAVAAQSEAPAAAPDAPKVVIVIHEGVELLDFAGPAEVFFATAAQTTTDAGAGLDVFTVAPTKDPIRSMGVVVTPTYSIDECPAPDIILVPGGATRRLLENEAFMTWIDDASDDADMLVSVCTGAFVLAKIGALDGQKATTHWGAIDALRANYPDITVLDDARYVDNGRVITTAGISAGIDGALHVVGRLFGRARAEEVARYMEYTWNPIPEYEALYRPTDETAAAIDLAALQMQARKHFRDEDWPGAVTALRKVIAVAPDDSDSIYYMGLALHMNGELDEAIEFHKRATRSDTWKQRGYYNLACAYSLKKDADAALTALENAIEAGWADLAWMEGDSDLDFVRADPRFETIIAGIDGS